MLVNQTLDPLPYERFGLPPVGLSYTVRDGIAAIEEKHKAKKFYEIYNRLYNAELLSGQSKFEAAAFADEMANWCVYAR
jgi:hypothetical protein